MADLLDNLDIIAKALKEGNFGLLSDFDGTLSYMAPTPTQAIISAPARRYLSALSRYLKLVAVISGRSLDDIRNMVRLRDITYVGNHGLEMWIDGRKETVGDSVAFGYRLSMAKALIDPLLKEEGVFFENKGISATIHYRLNPQPQEVERELIKRLKKIDGLHLMKGKRSINIMPPLEVSKGSVTTELISRFSLRGAAYLGDDVTDIEAFKALRQASRGQVFRGFAVAVIDREAPPELVKEADFTLSGIVGVESFLNWLHRQVAPLVW